MNTTKVEGVPPSPPLLRVLILGDNPPDAKHAVALLEGGGYRVQFATPVSPESFRKHVEAAEHDVILADFNLGNWTALDALEILKHSGKDIPLIVYTVSLGEEAAAECIKRGAADYVLKDRPARLPAAVQRALEVRSLRAERKRAEEALRQSEARLKETLLAAQMGVWQWTPASDTVTWDENLYRIAGRDPKLPAPSYQEQQQLYAPESWERLKVAVEKALSTGTPYELDLKMVRPDGSERWVDDRGEPRRDAGGRIKQLCGTLQDITERKRAEEALRESEERFRTTFENAGIGMALVDMRGHPTKSNPALRWMLGYSEEELSRMAFTEFTHPDDRELDWWLYNELTAGKRDKYEIEKRFLKKGGGVVWGLLTVSKVEGRDGRPLYATGMVQDITERKRAEEALRESDQRYKDFISHSVEGVWRVELEQPIPIDLPEEEIIERLLQYGYLAECNLAHARNYGFSTSEEMLGIRLRDLVPSSDQERLESFRSAARGGWRSRTIEFRSRDRAGNPKYFLRTDIPIIQNGMLIRVWGITRDITELRQAEQELRRSEARWRAVFDNSAVGIALTDCISTQFQAANLAFQKMVGYEEEELRATTFMNITYADDREPNRQLLSEVLEGRRQSFAMEKRYRRKDDSLVWVNLHVSLVPGTESVPRFSLAIVEDITERKQAEEQLRKLSLAVEQSPATVVITDLQGNIEYVNPKFTQLTGYTLEDAIGQNPRMLKSGLVPAATYQELWETILAGGEWRGEFANKKKNGEIYWESASIVPIRDSGGAITHFLAVKEDITERKRAEEALRQSDQRYKDFISHSNEGVWRMEMEQPIPIDLPEEEFLERGLQYGYLAECNLAHARILGFSTLEEVIGRRLQDLFPASDQERLVSFRAAARGGWQSQTVEFRGRDKSGNLRHLLRTEIPIVQNGMLVRAWGITRDITELKRAQEELGRSQEELQSVLAAIPHYLWSAEIDSQGHVSHRYYSPVVEKITGRPAEFYMPGPERWLSTIHPDDRSRVQTAVEVLSAGQLPLLTEEYRIILPDGTVRWVRDSVQARQQDGRIRIDGVVSDVSELKRAEEERQRSFDQLRALAGRLQSVREEERKSVAREIHDQLGQALTAMKIDLSSLVRELPAGDDQAAKRTASILELVDESIHTVRRISTDLRPGILDDLGLVAALEWAGEDFQARTGTACRLDLPPDDIAVDPERATAIFRIFQETLTNVARYADANKVEVHLAQEDGNLTLEVHDNGKGILEDKLSNGESLGILGMRERAMRLGGELTISGPPANGTTVRVRIPEAPSESARISPQRQLFSSSGRKGGGSELV